MQEHNFQKDQNETMPLQTVPPLTKQTRGAIVVAVLLGGYMLVLLGGGFPPQAWRFLLLSLRGIPVEFPLTQILVQSFVMAVAWLLLVLATFHAMRSGPRGKKNLSPPQNLGVKSGTTLLAQQSKIWTPYHPSPNQSTAPSNRSTAELDQNAPPQGLFWGRSPYHLPQSPSPTEPTGTTYAFSSNGKGATGQIEGSSQRDGEPSQPFLPSSPDDREKDLVPSHSSQKREEVTNRGVNDMRTPWEEWAINHDQVQPLPGPPAHPEVSTSEINQQKVLSLLTVSSREKPVPTPFYVRPSIPEGQVQPQSQMKQLLNIELRGTALASSGSQGLQDTREDFLLIASGITPQLPFNPYGLLVVADGTPCSGGVQTTSRVVASAMSEHLLAALTHNTPIDPDGMRGLLTESTQYANTMLYKSNQQQSETKIATIASILVLGLTAFVANVGDARAYVYRATEGLIQISYDHLTRAKEFEQGNVSAADLYKEEKETQLYRTLGQEPSIPVDTFFVQLQPGDVLLLCSDGIWKFVRTPALQQIIAQATSHTLDDPSLLAGSFLRSALEAGGIDNLGVIVAHVRDVSETG